MQTIAEEVVSSSGGGGTYITSGFSNYVGHSAIGFGTSLHRSSGDYFEGACIGIMGSERDSPYFIGFEGFLFTTNNHSPRVYVIDYFQWDESSSDKDACFIVF